MCPGTRGSLGRAGPRPRLIAGPARDHLPSTRPGPGCCARRRGAGQSRDDHRLARGRLDRLVQQLPLSHGSAQRLNSGLIITSLEGGRADFAKRLDGESLRRPGGVLVRLRDPRGVVPCGLGTLRVVGPVSSRAQLEHRELTMDLRPLGVHPIVQWTSPVLLAAGLPDQADQLVVLRGRPLQVLGSHGVVPFEEAQLAHPLECPRVVQDLVLPLPNHVGGLLPVPNPTPEVLPSIPVLGEHLRRWPVVGVGNGLIQLL